MKYYENINYSENVMPLSSWLEFMKEPDIKLDEIKLELCSRDVGGPMWCKTLDEFVERGHGECGSFCKDYKPCNGKSGKCKELVNGFDGTRQYFILNQNGKLREAKKGE